MPRRPRQHRLEDEARTAFRATLPEGWLFRDSVPDYGIDGQVEIFDEDDRGTGHLFLVQLKGTDKHDLTNALAVQLRLDTCEYYRKLDLPVLIVLYHAPTAKIYVKWFHTYDPYYGRGARKSITFKLNLQDEWDERTAERLLSDLEAIRKVRSPQLPLPISFLIEFKDQEVHGLSSGQIALELSKAVARLPGIIEISQSPANNIYASIVIANDKTVINLADVKSLTLHTSHGYPTETVLAKFPHDILVGAAMALDYAGHSGVAAKLISEYAKSSSILYLPELLVRVSQCLARAGRLTEALELSEILFEREEYLPAQILMLPALVLADSMSASERTYLHLFLKKRIERAEQLGNVGLAASAHYNLGNHLKATNRDKYRLASLRHYRKAAVLDQGYWERSYFYRELAGILFESKRYRLAETFYKRALDLGEESLCRALHADAMMMTGKYGEAQEAFDAYIKTSEEFDAEWRLKAWALRGVRRTFGIDEQSRQSLRANELAGSINKETSTEECKRKLRESLSVDALCALAWFNLGVIESQEENRDEAFLSFLMCALIRNGDVESWSNALALAIFSDEYFFLIPWLVHTAYVVNGERFTEAVVRLAQSQPEGFRTTEFINTLTTLISEIRSKIPQSPRPFELRLLGEGAEYRVINLREDRASETDLS